MNDNFDPIDMIEPRPDKLCWAEWFVVYAILVPAAIFVFICDAARGKVQR